MGMQIVAAAGGGGGVDFSPVQTSSVAALHSPQYFFYCYCSQYNSVFVGRCRRCQYCGAVK